MAQIDLVHGVGQEQFSADDLENEWLPSLAGGVRNAGYHALADQLWPVHNGVERLVRMAFYGGLFLTPDQQSSSDHLLGLEQLNTAGEIALEWMNNALGSTRPRDVGAAQLELQALHRHPDEAQGLRASGRRMVAALDHVPWITQGGLVGLGHINKTLAQVVRYLTEPDIRAQAIRYVHQLLDENTRVIIGHSLGSVVAYEAIRDRQQPLSLLITLGSPLGLNAINRRLEHPPRFPSGVARWVNLADRDDIVAARPQLASAFDINRPPIARFDSTYTVDNGAQPHRAGFYLTKIATGQAIGEAMSDTGRVG